MRAKRVGLTLAMLVLISLPFSGVQRIPIGEIITGGEGHVLVNGVRVAWGSTVFNGSEIQTSTSTAFIRFSEGATVLSISEDSRVRISREQGRIIAEVLQGSVAVRADVATRIVASSRIIESDPANIYSVALSEAGAEPLVRTFQKPVKVNAVGKLLTVLPEAAESTVESLIARINGPQPEAALAAVVTPTSALSIDCIAVLAGCKLTVTQGTFGVLSFGKPVVGATVRDTVSFRRRAPRAAGAAKSVAGGKYTIVHALSAAQCKVAPFGGTVSVLATFGRYRAANECTF